MSTWPESVAGNEIGDGRFALAVDRPTTIDELKAIVAKRASKAQADLSARRLRLARLRRRLRAPGIAIDMRSLDRVIDYPHADMTITVEAGITLAKLRDVVRA